MGDPISGAAESGRAVISKWLAKQNSLTVGDKLTVRFLEGTEDGDDDRAEAESERTVTVSGIFESPGLSVEQQGAVPPALRMENQIFADFSVSKGTTAAHEFERVSFYLEDPEALDAFAEELYESLGGRYEISDRSGIDVYKRQPMLSMRDRRESSSASGGVFSKSWLDSIT